MSETIKAFLNNPWVRFENGHEEIIFIHLLNNPREMRARELQFTRGGTGMKLLLTQVLIREEGNNSLPGGERE